MESVKIHDLLRDLALREARKLKFLFEYGEHSIPPTSQRRLASTLSESPPNPLLESLISASLTRSLLGKFPETLSLSSFRLLRVGGFDQFNVQWDDSQYSEEESSEYYEEFFTRQVNLRLCSVDLDKYSLPRIPSSVSLLWNLQTLIISGIVYDFVIDIWKMPQLRHVLGDAYGTICLPDPLRGEVVLQNLGNIFVVSNLSIGEEVLRRIPNVKILKLSYYAGGDHCLQNLQRLHKLQLLRLRCSRTFRLTREVALPYSLKKLTLENTRLHWEDMKTKIGPLPLLKVLKLKDNAFIGSEWETVEGQFSSLRFLRIQGCDLEHWITEDNTHFPRLEHLSLWSLEKLREIPYGIGDILTLRSIKLVSCSDSAAESARRVVEEQEELGNEDLRLEIH